MYTSGIDVRKRAIGVNFDTNQQATIRLWGPLVKKAAILVKKNQQVLELEQEDYGYWKLNTSLIEPGDHYQFLLDGNKLCPDPAFLMQLNGVHGASTAFNLTNYEWKDDHWTNFPLGEYIIYELHTGTFSPEGNFAGIEQRINYLRDLGIKAIEIMPVAQFSGNRNWGYDGVYPFAVQDSYGGPEALQHLVDTCHSKGLAVILDVVYNHMGPEGNYMHKLGPYFTSKHKIPWGDAINFDDEWCDGVRAYFIENALMWFRDFHIDALRLDAVHAIKDLSACHILKAIKSATNELMEETGRIHYLLIESDLNDTRLIDPFIKGGYGMEAQWADEFHHALRVSAGGSRDGYYADFDGIAHLAKAYKNAYVYDGTYSKHRKRTFGIPTTHNPGKQFIIFSQNHDQVGNRMLGERTSRLMSFEMCKLMAGAVIVAPFIPLLFMGEEYGETNPFLYFVSHEDPGLREIVKEGRRNEFAAFHAQGEAPDPSSEETFEHSKLQWQLTEQQPHSVLLNYYKSLIALRQNHAVLNNLNKDQIEVTYEETQKTMLVHRWQRNQHVLILMNFSNRPASVELPELAKRWHKLFDSASKEWNGAHQSPDITYANDPISLPPESFLIYE